MKTRERPCLASHPVPIDDREACGVCWVYLHDPAYRSLYGGGGPAPAPREPPRPRATSPATAGGPGTELARLIASLGLRVEGCLGCGGWVARMDLWGVEGCQLRREEILSRLREQAAKLGWLDWLRAGGLAAARGLALNPLDPAPGLLDEALRRAALPRLSGGDPTG